MKIEVFILTILKNSQLLNKTYFTINIKDLRERCLKVRKMLLELLTSINVKRR